MENVNGEESAGGAVMTTGYRAANEPSVRRIILWFGVLGPPVAWAMQLFVDYYLASLRCAPGFTANSWAGVSVFTVLIVAMTVLMAVVACLAGLGALSIWRGLDVNVEETIEGDTGRVAFMALGGMLESLFFLLIIIVSGVPNLTLGCAV
jgi:hypothetical protein